MNDAEPQEPLEPQQPPQTPGCSVYKPSRVVLTLSRPTYRPGGTVVGTVRLLSPTRREDGDGVEDDGGDGAQADSPPPPHPRTVFTSATLYLAGRCRIDPRWHTPETYSHLYGSHPLLSSLDPSVEKRAIDAYFGERNDGVHVEGGATVCFWATNVVDLLELNEGGKKWEEQMPQPLKLEGGEWSKLEYDPPQRIEEAENDLEYGDDEQDEDEEESVGTSNTGVVENGTHTNAEATENGTTHEPEVQQLYCLEKRMEERHVAITFRADVPVDVPHTASTTCCRYFYSVVVCAKTTWGELIVVQAPFVVLSGRAGANQQPQKQQPKLTGTTRVKVGTCNAMAHSAGLPCYVTATALNHQPQISVNRNAVGLCSTGIMNDVRSLRVADEHGTPCCLLTIVGASVMHPGSRILLQLDFDEGILLRGAGTGDGDEPSHTRSLLPCHQVCACLDGEEVAIYDDGSRRRARSYVFDSAHELVESGYTESVYLSLALPLDCPCTLRTDLVEIAVRCKVELTVERAGGEGGYSALRLELPCDVVHGTTAEEEGEGEEEEEDGNGMASDAMDRFLWGAEGQSMPGQSTTFATRDIIKDLTMLSLHMIDDNA